MKENKITVFTPTYNRAYILKNLYESLMRQTVQKFEWLIVDDGSTDETADLVATWQKENKPGISGFQRKRCLYKRYFGLGSGVYSGRGMGRCDRSLYGSYEYGEEQLSGTLYVHIGGCHSLRGYAG